MSDLPYVTPLPVADEITGALDVEGKIPRALDALGPTGGRDVAYVGDPHGIARRLADLGARVTIIAGEPGLDGLAAGSLDAVVAAWSGFRGVDPAEVSAADRVLRPGGRLLVIHDYGRDDVSHLRSRDLPEFTTWSRRDGPFLQSGFRIRVLHCFWTFRDVSTMQRVVEAGFGAAGAAVVEGRSRPRLSWNVAIYHRSKGAEPA